MSAVHGTLRVAVWRGWLNLKTTRFTTIVLDGDDKLVTGSGPVAFTIVRPGESLVEDEAGAPPELAPPPTAAE